MGRAASWCPCKASSTSPPRRSSNGGSWSCCPSPSTASRSDLAGLTFLDSSGLGALYRTRQAAGEQGVALRLQEVPAHVMRVLDVTAMAQLFDLDARSA